MNAVSLPFWHRSPQRPLVKRRVQKTAVPCAICQQPAHLPGIPVDLAISIAAQQFGVSHADLVSHRRRDDLVMARAFAVWALRTLGQPQTYVQIGLALGGRDHATIINLHEKAICLRLTHPAFAAACHRLSSNFYALREHHDGIR